MRVRSYELVRKFGVEDRIEPDVVMNLVWSKDRNTDVVGVVNPGFWDGREFE